MASPCAVCDSALIRGGGAPPHDVDIALTSRELQRRVDSGQMRYLRGDVALEEMLQLADSDMKYTIVSFLECTACGQTRFWGLCIRGAPIYRSADPAEVSRWSWEPIPSRELWLKA